MRIAIALVLLATACGGSKNTLVDGGPEADAMADAMVDAPPAEATLTSYVIDLITTQTTATATARPYVEFATLPDPDTANTTAYQSLF